DDAIADLQVLDVAPDFHHFAHELVAEHVAFHHGLHEAVVKMQVGAEGGRRRNGDDRVALVQDLRLGDVAHFHLLRAHPTGGFHRVLPSAGWALPCFNGPWPIPPRLPSERTTSPVSITCLKRRRSSRTCCCGSSPNHFATVAPAVPPGAS